MEREQIITQMQEWCDNMCENACLKGESLNGKIHTCEICFPNTVKNALALINQLTEENEAWQKQLIATEEKADNAYYELACEVENLRTENANLHASCTDLTRKCASLTEENERLMREKTALECVVSTARNQAKADTVRKMQERLKARKFTHKNFGEHVYVEDIDQIAKEMLEGEDEKEKGF